jgi:hypothetical protein
MITTLLKPDDYYTQRNNKTFGYRACMPTTRVMFFKANNIVYTNPTDKADDDYFMDLLLTDESKEFCYKNFPWAYNAKQPDKSIWPNEVHSMYNSWLDGKVVGKVVSDFVTNLTFDSYVDSILNKGMAIMTSGTFGEIAGHAVLFMGYDTNTNELIIADPYGDYKSKYRNTKGYGIRMNYEEFNTHIKPSDSFYKWGHITL